MYHLTTEELFQIEEFHIVRKRVKLKPQGSPTLPSLEMMNTYKLNDKNDRFVFSRFLSAPKE